MDYAIVIQRLPDDEGGGYLAYFPELPGCAGDGETPEEALADAQSALLELRDTCRAKGWHLPEPKPFRQPPAPGGPRQAAPSPQLLPGDPEALFEVHTIEAGVARAYRVYTNGHVSGFGKYTKLINRYAKMRSRDLEEISQPQLAK